MTVAVVCGAGCPDGTAFTRSGDNKSRSPVPLRGLPAPLLGISPLFSRVSRRPHKIISERGNPAVRDVPFGPAPLCVGIVTSPNPSVFAQSIFYRPLLSPGGVCGVTSSGQPRTPTRPASLFAATFCAGDPDVAVNAGHHRLLTKACERVFCARLNGPMCTVKYGLPPVNVAAIKKSLA
ncbi:hypothetical protein Q8A67_019130 [Cirrhinus molitorella]|uniref:Uncharacterized protein n=1 Tax=Cirrhinus molitorella TaxID=172907 RepID=A0AA88P6N7_9TELE|nr:hypothetical protein Q8A67_019130 [Cirrhinus molitorella]